MVPKRSLNDNVRAALSNKISPAMDSMIENSNNLKFKNKFSERWNHIMKVECK